VREDLGIDPVFPKPLPYYYSVRDALPWVKSQTKGFGFGKGAMIDAIVPSGTIGTGPNQGNGLFPPSMIEAEADISRFAIGREWEKLRPGETSDRYLNLVKPLLDKPSPTVTVGVATGSATVTHPTEKRRFSIAELKRICAFPADFQLTGSYLQQWERLGRAVPPVMMRAVAESIRDGILGQIKV
jgi:DNA (cytosine-5)-methyltransferase 1